MNYELPTGTVLCLRTNSAEMTSHNDFQWPTEGRIAAPDWNPDRTCGGGLHGLLWGAGNGALLNWESDAKWLVVEVDASKIVDLGGKVKFPECTVIHVGDRVSAPELLAKFAPAGTPIVGGTATAGDRGTATAGDRGTATAGDHGTATAGDRGTATAGDHGTATAGDGGTATAGVGGTATAGYRGTATAGDGGTATAGVGGTATAGYRGTATAGYRGTATAGDRGTATAGDGGTATAGDGGTATAGDGGIIAIQRWNGKHYKLVCADVGDDGLEQNRAYKLDGDGNFVEA